MNRAQFTANLRQLAVTERAKGTTRREIETLMAQGAAKGIEEIPLGLRGLTRARLKTIIDGVLGEVFGPA